MRAALVRRFQSPGLAAVGARWLGQGFWFPFCLLFAGCSSLDYYAQAVRGHVDLLGRRQDIQWLIQQPDTPRTLRRRLQLILEIRDFASRELLLPDNGSYRSYADLGREAAVWSLVAAPEFSIQPHEWCYPVIGCASYRGYFERQAAVQAGADLTAQGLDVALEPVPAYSSLGWFDDPLPSTVIDWSEPELAGLIFHELAHQRLYFAGDSGFNEAFASLVQQVGVGRWLASRGDANALERYQAGTRRREDFIQLLLESRGRLDRLYTQPLEPSVMRERKAVEFERLAASYQALKQRWEGYAGYDAWFERGPLNNARLASVATYQALLPALQQLLNTNAGDLAAFYTACGALKNLSPDQRRRRLEY